MDLFFKIPKNKSEKIIREAMLMSKWIKCDQLDCNVSSARQDTDKTPEDVLKLGLENKHTMWHFVIRYKDRNIPDRTDIGLSTGGHINGIEYFLWIDMDVDKAYDLALKHKLKLIR